MIGPGGRVAVYYAPAADDPLAAAAASWLGRDALTGAACAQPDIAGLAEMTAQAAVYGFHATLKPPLQLRNGTNWDEFVAAARHVAAGIPAFELPPMAVTNLRGFLALCETAPSPELQAMADACVAELDEFRQPPDDAELARRSKGGLSASQDEMLRRWGYPHVFSTWFFHLTLTRRLSAEEDARVRPAAEAHFAAALGQSRQVRELCLFTQAEPGGAFIVAARIKLAGL